MTEPTCRGCGRSIACLRGSTLWPHRRVARDSASAWCDGRPAPARVSLRITSVEISAEGEVSVGAALGMLRALGAG